MQRVNILKAILILTLGVLSHLAFAVNSIPLLVQEGLSTSQQNRYLVLECQSELGYLDCYKVGEASGQQVNEAVKYAYPTRRPRDLFLRARNAGILMVGVPSFSALEGFHPIAYLGSQRMSASRGVTIYDAFGSTELRINYSSLSKRGQVYRLLAGQPPEDLRARDSFFDKLKRSMN